MSLFLSALKCQNQGRPPVWLMRQAGRYLPEYHKLKANRPLFECFHNVETIVKVTKLPVDLLSVDAAILFSDILTVFDGLNIRYDFKEGLGPVVFSEPYDIQRRDPNGAYEHVVKSIEILKKELTVPLIGFAGAPFTVVSYLMEKGSSKEYKKTKKALFSHPLEFEKLIEIVTDATIDYLKCQEKAGVDAIQIFDSWAHVLGIEEFRSYCLQPLKKIVASLSCPVILFARGLYAKEFKELSPHAISFDSSVNLPEIRDEIPSSIALQGNLDPMLLYAPRSEIKKALDKLLSRMREEKRFIVNVGHGLLPDTPQDHVKFLVDYVRAFT